jgi:predicted ArsR family transcriptional regulator
MSVRPIERAAIRGVATALAHVFVRARPDGGRLASAGRALARRSVELAVRLEPGTRGWAHLAAFFEELGRARAPLLRARLGLVNGDLRSLAKLQDWEDAVLGVEGTWEVLEEGAATKVEHHCPFARAATRRPEFCSDLVRRFELATFRELAPGYELSVPTLLSRGDAGCRFQHRIARS